MEQATKKSKGYVAQLSLMLEDYGIPLDSATALGKFKVFSSQSIISQNTRSATLTISPSQLIEVREEIGEEKDKAKKTSKPTNPSSADVPKSKAKWNLVIEKSDS